ncbi:hypothetical protein GJ744_010936, partial [Endocarpon pusillum]
SFDRLRHVSISDTSLFDTDALGKYTSWERRKSESYDQIRAQWLDLRDLMPKTLETLRILLQREYWPLDRNPRHRVVAFYSMLEDFVRSKYTETHVLENFRLLCIMGLAETATLTSGPNLGNSNSYFTSLKNSCNVRRQKQPLELVPADECPWHGIGEAPDPTSLTTADIRDT